MLWLMENPVLQTAEDNIEDMLIAEGITVNESDKVNPPRTQAITDGMNIKITRVTSQLVKGLTKY